MKINIRLLVLFTGAYLVALVALTPLSWVRQYAEPLLRAQGIKLQDVNGNIWHGSSQLSVSGHDPFQLDWQTRPEGIFLARLPIDVQVTNPYLDVTGQVQLKPTGLAVEAVSGYVDEQAFAPYAKAYNATIQGRMVASDLSASIGWGGSLGNADGDLSWSGGPVQVNRSSQTFEVPQMQGDITSDERAWSVRIGGLDDTSFITAELTRDGNSEVIVKSALAERMKLPIPGGGRDILFQMTQKVF